MWPHFKFCNNQKNIQTFYKTLSKLFNLENIIFQEDCLDLGACTAVKSYRTISFRSQIATQNSFQNSISELLEKLTLTLLSLLEDRKAAFVQK